MIHRTYKTLDFKAIICEGLLMETLINPQSDNDVLKLITATMEDTKAENIALLSLKKLGAFTDYLVICSANNDRQVAAIADNIVLSLKHKANLRPIGIEGTQMGQWVLIDYGHIVCHVFLNEVRDFYRLEEMWQDAESLNATSGGSPEPKSKKSPARKKAAPKKAAPKKAAAKKAPTKKAPAKSLKKPVKKTTAKKKAAPKAKKKTKK